MIIKKIGAGVAIGIGGAAYLLTGNPLTFTIGLFIVLVCDLHLFTGRACFIDDGYDLLQTYLLNIAGTLLIAQTLTLTRFGPRLTEAANALCYAKAADTFPSLLILGILCNFLIFIAVYQYRRTTGAARYFGLAAIPIFIMCGFEHSIADAFYLSFGAPVIEMLVPVSIGNLIGARICRKLSLEIGGN